MKFNSVIFSPDLYSAMDEYYKIQTILKKEICSAFGINIQVEKALPPNSALFVDHRGNIVAVFTDGKLVELPQDFAINYLALHPSVLKKTPGG